MASRQLIYVNLADVPQGREYKMLLCNDRGEVLKTYLCDRVWRTIEWNGWKYRFNGADRATAEFIYLPEAA